MKNKNKLTLEELLEVLSNSRIICDKKTCKEKGYKLLCYEEKYKHCEEYFKDDTRM